MPSHAIEYDFQARNRNDDSHLSGKLVWSKHDEPLHGFEYVYDVEKGQDSSYNFVVRRVGREEQTFATRYQMTNGGTQKAIYVDINHSHDASRRITMEVIHQKNSLTKFACVGLWVFFLKL